MAVTTNPGTVNYTDHTASADLVTWPTGNTGNGSGSGTLNGNTLDDTVMGPAAAACMTCHQSGDTGTQNALRAHAYQNGWVPQVFTNGRQSIIDAVVQ